ncbi:MAG: rod shape-determining protein MreD [Actinomycetota bacterium]|nr:rod shape-determining protein MreD [Actinomycetota bacterium]
MISSWLKLLVLLLGALVLHQTLFAAIGFADVRPQLMLLAAVAGGMVGGSDRGAVVGFLCGLLSDLFLQTPLGLSALSFSLVAFAVGTVQSSVIRSAWWIPPLTAFVASAAGIVLYALLGALVGQDHLVRPALLAVAVAAGAVNAALAPFMVKAMSWAITDSAESSYAR